MGVLRQHQVGVLLVGGVQRVGGDRATGEVERRQQRGQGGDLGVLSREIADG
jgi:hypothetical protein